ncbi:histidine phosphatase family protein [Henriciella sp.]|uniref:histidine phosphatase family protein n=1 Tax=Henriciella sp. TaxID=1968823 RepID=UPI002604ED5D|nr:histidine phosphatase family protein [Henriciella sp.]
MSRKVYIVRHGNTFDRGDTVTRVGARTDLPLSRSGQEQADALAKHFSSMQTAFSRIVTSPLKRTRQTAETIAAAQPSAPDLETAPFLREIDYGPDENQPEADVVARIGDAALEAWERRAVPPPGWNVDPPAIIGNWDKFFASVAKEPVSGPVLVVTSNGVARFALLAARQANPELNIEASDLKLKTGAYGILSIEADAKPGLLDWNIRP